MTSRVQTLRFDTPGQRPVTGEHAPGELWVNVPDRAFGVIDSSRVAVALNDIASTRAVAPYDPARPYAVGDMALYGDQLYIAKAGVEPGAWDAADWDSYDKRRGRLLVSDFLQPGDAEANDYSATIQAAIDYLRTTYDAGTGDFTYKLDFGGRSWRVTQSINATLIRQPSFTLENGGIFGSCPGKIVLDLAGTNALELYNFEVYGDIAAPPAIGIYIGRADVSLDHSGSFGVAPNAKLFQLAVDGEFTQSAFVNIGSEVSSEYGCEYFNRSPNLNAYSYISVGGMQSLEDAVGPVTSDYADLPTPADGLFSNILHEVTQIKAQRPQKVLLALTDISNTNPAVATCLPAALLASGLADGQGVCLFGAGPMEDLQGYVFTADNVDTDAGTFDMVGADATLLPAFTSGQIRNQTGPAMWLGGGDAMHMESSYLQAYGSPTLIIDVASQLNRGHRLSFQSETWNSPIVRFRVGAATEVIQNFDLTIFNTSQVNRGSVIDISGGVGGIRVDNLRLKIINQRDPPANGIFDDPSRWNLRNAQIEVALEAAMNPLGDFAAFSGSVFAADTNAYHSRGIWSQHFTQTTSPTVQGEVTWTGHAMEWFDGVPRKVVGYYESTESVLADITHSINTVGKYRGKQCYCYDTDKLYIATESTAGAVWKVCDASGTITPV
jgi:hypothetical protein